MDTDPVAISVVMQQTPDAHRIVVSGDVDQVGVIALGQALADAVALRPTRIEVDLGGATFFCCAAVTSLMNARAANRGRLTVISAAPVVHKVLRLVGLSATLGTGEHLAAVCEPEPGSQRVLSPGVSGRSL
jgi:anti-anti-sigma factor